MMRPAGCEFSVDAVPIRLRLLADDDSTEPASPCFVNSPLTARVQAQLADARRAQSHWSGRSVPERLNILKSLRMRMAADPRALASRVARDDLAVTLAAEVLPLLDACRFLESSATRVLKERRVGAQGRPTWLWGTKLVLQNEPLGVVLIIGPSNYPLMLPGIQALQAIAAGNGVLLKPAVNCSAPLAAMLAMAAEAGLPDGLIQILPESPDAATVAIQSSVDKVFLTGSASTGRAVSLELARSTTPSVMELSGCDAVFVLEDADPELVSDCLLFGLTLNNGRTCMAPRRVFASDRNADRILQLLRQKIDARKLREMQATGQSRSVPSLPLELAARKISEAVAGGAELVAGSLQGHNPTVLNGVAILDRVTSDMAIAQSDLFAPVLSFIRVRCATQALQENARCPYALSATVFGSARRCRELARRIRAGCVVINDMIVPTADPRVPFGGCGQSGHGTTRGEAGLLEMTQPRAIVSARPWFRPHLKCPTSADADVLTQLIRIEHAASPLQSLIAVPGMIKATIEQIRLRRSQVK